jgi:hypothetical protein
MPNGPRKGTPGTVRGKADSLLRVPVNFGKRSGGIILVLITDLEKYEQ